MELLAGPKEAIYPKNVALMMFNDHPEKFFPCTQVDIVMFPGGKVKDPNNFIEVPPITGPINAIFDKTMIYLETNVLKLKVKKVGTKSESEKAWNYPYAALEEIVANCLYHRDYRQREPIEIQVEPHELRFISYGGPDRSVRLEDFSKGIVNPRRYRNRRIGDFFKELDITEGKSTGVPTIVGAMKENGSPAVKFEFDEERTWFMVTVPVHEWFLEDDTENDIENGIEKMLQLPLVLTDRQLKIVGMIEKNDRVTTEEMMARCKVSLSTINRDISQLKKSGVLIRVGGDKGGYWMIARKVK
ncbi:MAG: DeoR family transcriptional regulator [Bacteroidaceae bacterium]|nr:DeoR family transcriptional regulator [Bacteroidaceae bacterium]